MTTLQGLLNRAFSTPRRRDAYYGRARRLAAALSIEVTVEEPGAYWIEDDRLEGEQFCTSWQEVHGKLDDLRSRA